MTISVKNEKIRRGAGFHIFRKVFRKPVGEVAGDIINVKRDLCVNLLNSQR